ncbi:cytosolic endo-beta-N-acetylglucosaminidase 1 isoform X2 [Castanea sativa]|uniref:cytosolic endo-beta-N-acetylglucosaminidase 1 isoform X2 n=1 Tax=Castanea sativa TaxID=21020 RepID=UPI003F650144
MLSLPLKFDCLRRRNIVKHLKLVRNKLQNLLCFVKMSVSESELQPPPPPPFDPTLPSLPISYPIKTLKDLESRSYFNSFHYPFNKASVPLKSVLPNRRRLLVCHDMAGGYLDDKWVQGGTNSEAYGIWHWYLMDVFVYFSHTLVTLPPPCWTNTAHRHGVKVLGTFITEWDEGRVACNELLSTKESAHMYAECLAELAVALGFDGWLENYPRDSAAVAGDRNFDVYMGIDVFGRNTYGGGQWNTNDALDVIKKGETSAAIFAPAWNYETHQLPNFQTSQNRWWGLVEKSWGIVQNYPKDLPFYTNFDQGRGYHFSVDGAEISKDPWYNLSCQGFQPLLEFVDNPTLDSIQTLVDFNKASYSGGGNVTFKGTLEENAFFTRRLFHGELLLGDLPVNFTYSVKSEGDSQLGLSLQFSSTMNKSMSILLASQEIYQFSSKFSQVITTRPHEKPGNSPGWVIQEASIAMNGYTLTEIYAVCYRSKPEFNKPRPAHNPVKYFAVLGHITIKNSDKKSGFPPSSSWIVEAQFIKWASVSQGSKTLSVKLIWKLKDGTDTVFPNYNIYAKKLAKQVVSDQDGSLEDVPKYLGTAHVEAFYVSDLSVPCETSSLKFIVQVCAADGTCQKLDDSPTFSIDVEGQ